MTQWRSKHIALTIYYFKVYEINCCVIGWHICVFYILDLYLTIDYNILPLCVFLDSCALKLRVCIPLETWIDTLFYGVACEWLHCTSASSPTVGYGLPVSIPCFQIYFPVRVKFGSTDLHTTSWNPCENRENHGQKAVFYCRCELNYT